MGDDAALAAVEACLRLGAREFVICAGARNVEIVAALTARSDVRLHHHPEERSAGFFGLGRSIASGAPVAVVTTSGTAAAELLPVAIEAFYQARSLLLVTADRPDRFRGRGAPQAIEQQTLFGPYAATDPECWRWDRPLHLNVPLEEPTPEAILRAVRNAETERPERGRPPDAEDAADQVSEFLRGASELFVMVGDLHESWRHGVRKFLLRCGAPMYIEATSGLRENVALPLRVEVGTHVLRIGGVPSCRFWRDLEDRPEVDVLSVTPNGLPGLGRAAEAVRWVDWEKVEVPPPSRVPVLPPRDVDPYLERHPLSEPAWFRWLSEAIPKWSLVFLGNSLPIREWNLAATYTYRGLRCFANRGANGIDGCVSTFLGLAVGETEAWLICGDLTALYDLAAPWMLGQIGAGDLRIVVINNGGGKIFARLPALEGVGEGTRTMIENPHRIDFEGWATMWNMSYRRVTAWDDLANLPPGPTVLEVIPDAAATASFWKDWGMG